MKHGVAVIGAVVLALAAHGAQAKTLEEVLKEKGVITEADYQDVIKSAPKSKPVDYKLGSGFSFTSPDEKYQLTIGGQVQTRYTFTEKGGNGTTNVSEWKIPRARTFFSGYFLTKDLTFKSNQDWAALNNYNSTNNSNTSKVLLETFVNYRIVDEAQIRVGQDKVQFSRQYITSTSQNEFVDNSFVTIAFAPTYDTGLSAFGSIGKGLFTYSAAWLGGRGQNVVSSTNNNAYNIRLTANPFGELFYSEADIQGSTKPLLAFGTSYYHDSVKIANGTVENNNLGYLGSNGWLTKSTGTFTGTQNINVQQFEVDAAFKWQGLALQGEYFWGQATSSASSSQNAISRGFYVQAGYLIVPKTVELAIRYNWLDYNVYKPDSLKSEIQWAASWYVEGHNLKLQADLTKSYVQQYADSRALAGSGVNDTIIRAQAQILF